MMTQRIILLLCSLFVSAQSMSLQINLNDQGGAAPGTLAGDAFSTAAQFWESLFSDPIEVNIDVGFSNLGTSVLAQAQSFSSATPYIDVRNALLNDMVTDDDMIAVDHLPITSFLTFLSNDPNGNIALDNNQTANNSFLNVNHANLKAIGLMGNNTAADATITFNNQFNYDYDQDDGVSSDLFDFVGIAIHEIGHALGFVSGVDIIDFYSSDGPGHGNIASFENFSIFSILDLFRFSERSLSFGAGVQDLAIDDVNQYFSIDNGLTAAAPFSTGRYNGDGFQASHWKNIDGIGIMEPTISRGEAGDFTETDLLGFDVIGFDPIPQEQEPPTPIPVPTSLTFFMLGLLMLFSYQRIFNLTQRTHCFHLRSFHAL